MVAFENKQGIKSIELFGKVRCFCPMGQDWYDADVEVCFYPTDTIMDYCDVDKFFEGMNNAERIIEDVVAETFAYFEAYRPELLSVEATVKNATHLPVKVYKDSNDY